MTGGTPIIFHMHCTVKDKVCKVVIDGSGTKNIIPQKDVKKLGLATEKHPRLLQVDLVQEGPWIEC